MPAPSFDDHSFLATAARGTEQIVRRELRDLGLERLKEVPGGVRFRGDMGDGMRACLWSHTAERVLLEIGKDELRGDHQLYPAVRNLPILDWFSPDHTIAVFAKTSGPVLTHSGYAALTAKDAIVDVLRDKHGRRPNVDPDSPDVVLAIHVIDGRASFYVEMQGAPLHERGYRVRAVAAPVKETLAASMLLYSGWEPGKKLIDPTCGSGTIAIEAGLMATDTAPGLYRGFGFERWPVFDSLLAGPWSVLLDEARDRRRPTAYADVHGSDIAGRTVGAARANAIKAGVHKAIVLEKRDAREIGPTEAHTHFVFNPPYGERIGGDEEDAGELAAEIVTAARRGEGDRYLTILAPFAVQKAAVPFPPDRSVEVYNGAIPCRLSRYTAYGQPMESDGDAPGE